MPAKSTLVRANSRSKVRERGAVAGLVAGCSGSTRVNVRRQRSIRRAFDAPVPEPLTSAPSRGRDTVRQQRRLNRLWQLSAHRPPSGFASRTAAVSESRS